MLACLITLMVTPIKAKVTIFTDSAATIDGMARIKKMMQLSVRKREKLLNFPIWMTIMHVLKVLDLNVKMVKVKAHSDDRLNDQADTLAKDITFSAPQLNLNFMKLLSLNLVLACDHLIIKAFSRSCIKQLQDANHFYQYLQLQ